MNLERARYILKNIEVERDELIHRIKNARDGDALKITGESILKRYAEQVNNAKRLVEELQ
jgi:hypothetical protein